MLHSARKRKRREERGTKTGASIYSTAELQTAKSISNA
jgi:hypothetical protein